MPLPDVTAGASGHVSHHNTLHDWTQVDEQIRYVSVGVNGNNANDGLTPFLPKATLQNAYDSLPAAGGVLMIMPGRHDVGSTGLQLTRTKPVSLRGPGVWQRVSGNVANWITGGGTVIYSGSGTPAALVSFPNPGTSNNGDGFEAHDLVFEVKSGMSYGIRADSVNRGVVEDCMFHMRSTTAVGISLGHNGTLGDDASWWRVVKNSCYGGRFFETTATSNHNQIVVAQNECINGSLAVAGPLITIKAGHRCVVRDNNLEGDTTSPFLLLQNSFGCMTSGNGGEGGGGGGQVFVRVDNSNGNLLMDMGFPVATATDKLYDFINGSFDNLVLTAAYSTAGSLYQAAATTVFADSDAAQPNSRITSGFASANRTSGTWLPRLKSGAGSPQSAVTGYIGDLYLRSDGGANTTLYIKESGNNTNTGWIAK